MKSLLFLLATMLLLNSPINATIPTDKKDIESSLKLADNYDLWSVSEAFNSSWQYVKEAAKITAKYGKETLDGTIALFYKYGPGAWAAVMENGPELVKYILENNEKILNLAEGVQGLRERNAAMNEKITKSKDDDKTNEEKTDEELAEEAAIKVKKAQDLAKTKEKLFGDKAAQKRLLDRFEARKAAEESSQEDADSPKAKTKGN